MVFSILMVQRFITIASQTKANYPSYNNTPEITIVIIFVIIGLFAASQWIWKKEGKKK